jgi:trigger factor
MAGKEASFKVKVVEIKQEVLPELNDDFAKQASTELKTFAELKERLAANLKLRAEEKSKREFEDKVVDAVVEQAKVEFPPVLVEGEVHSLIDDQARRFQMQGINYEDYLKSINKTGEQLHEEFHPIAEKRVIRSLVLGKVAEEEKIEVSEAEIDAEVENMVKGATEKKEELQKLFNSPRSRESIKQALLTRKTLEKLTELARSQSGEIVTPAVEAAKPEKTTEKREEAKQ